MRKALSALFLVGVLSGCASHPSARAPAPQSQITPETVLIQPSSPSSAPSDPPPARYYLDDGPPEDHNINIAAIPDAEPKLEPVHPGRNRPYRAFGKIYRPHPAPRAHRETGVASWYGRRYHGRATASGETYDMFKMTAAHPILTIPSYVRVTRADSGKSVVVRVNDRGPFLRGRVIDLSFAAASKLDIVRSGSAEVIVESVPPENAPFPDAPPAGNEKEAVVENAPSPAAPHVFFIQLGAFSGHLGAGKMLAEFEKNAPEKFRGRGTIVYDSLANLHRVGVGTYPGAEAARADLEALCDAGLCGFVAPMP